MRYILGSVITVAVFVLAASTGAQQNSISSKVDAEVVMKDKAFHITQGESGKGIILVSGERADIRLKNEDSVAHEFVSTMLFNVPFQLNGSGTLVKAPKAAGVRVDPGQSVVLSFDVPADTKEFQHIYEVFWCNVHGKQHGDAMRGEIIIVDQRGEVSGG
jgi:hypothetical protein